MPLILSSRQWSKKHQKKLMMQFKIRKQKKNTNAAPKKYSRRPKNINTLPEPRTILMEIYITPDKLEEIIDERLLL